MKFKTLIIIITSLLLVFTFEKSEAQNSMEDFIIPRTNSKAVIQQTIASTRIEISYNRPNKRGRTIFGQLVPYDNVWRTGADESTKISFNTPVSFEGNVVDSGEYEIFTIPGENKWEIILQKNQNQWGSYRYNPENDIVKFQVTPIEASPVIETFTISIDDVGSDHGILNISWDNIVVPIEIKIDLKSTVVPSLEQALAENSKPPYFQAAMFYYDNTIDFNRAAELMSLALERNPDHIGMLYRYALILKAKGDIPEAIKASEKSRESAQNAGPELKDEYIRLNSALLDELRSMKD